MLFNTVTDKRKIMHHRKPKRLRPLTIRRQNRRMSPPRVCHTMRTLQIASSPPAVHFRLGRERLPQKTQKTQKEASEWAFSRVSRRASFFSPWVIGEPQPAIRLAQEVGPRLLSDSFCVFCVFLWPFSVCAPAMHFRLSRERMATKKHKKHKKRRRNGHSRRCPDFNDNVTPCDSFLCFLRFFCGPFSCFLSSFRSHRPRRLCISHSAGRDCHKKNTKKGVRMGITLLRFSLTHLLTLRFPLRILRFFCGHSSVALRRGLYRDRNA